MKQSDKLEKRRIGHAQKPFRGVIERVKLIEFAQGLSLRNAIYSDLSAAREAGYRDIVEPPGFITSFSLQPRDEKIAAFALDQKRTLVGGLRWQHYGVICAGDDLHGQTVLTGVERSKGRRSAEVLTIETR